MNERLYNLMDWAEIEAVTYAETDNPHSLLGAQVTDEGILIQTFVPTAAASSVGCGKKTYPMELEDEAGFFAAPDTPKGCVAQPLAFYFKIRTFKTPSIFFRLSRTASEG